MNNELLIEAKLEVLKNLLRAGKITTGQFVRMVSALKNKTSALKGVSSTVKNKSVLAAYKYKPMAFSTLSDPTIAMTFQSIGRYVA